MNRSWYVYLENPPAYIPNQMPFFVYQLLDFLGFFKGLWRKVGCCSHCGITLVRFATSETVLTHMYGLPESGVCLDLHCLDAVYPDRHDQGPLEYDEAIPF